jgi:hypothetical protein
VLSTAAKFLLVPRGGPWPLEKVRGDKARADGSEAANRANVQYHYDVSNVFYALFLDPEMVYTCAYFAEPEHDIATAQRAKLDMICRKLRLAPGETLLDIGCGWGGLICHAAQHYGVRAHGVTLADEQYAYARDKVRSLGLQDRVTLEVRDYALVEGIFDKIASIEMFEQVGLANHPTYFQTVNRRADFTCTKRLRGAAPATIAAGGGDDPSRRRWRGTSFPGERSITSGCRSPTSSVTASRCTTSRAGASTMRARPGIGTIGCSRTAPRPCTRSAVSKRGCGSPIWPVARLPSSAAQWVSSRRSPRNAPEDHRDFRSRVAICIKVSRMRFSRD